MGRSTLFPGLIWLLDCSYLTGTSVCVDICAYEPRPEQTIEPRRMGTEHTAPIIVFRAKISSAQVPEQGDEYWDHKCMETVILKGNRITLVSVAKLPPPKLHLVAAIRMVELRKCLLQANFTHARTLTS